MSFSSVTTKSYIGVAVAVGVGVDVDVGVKVEVGVAVRVNVAGSTGRLVAVALGAGVDVPGARGPSDWFAAVFWFVGSAVGTGRVGATPRWIAGTGVETTGTVGSGDTISAGLAWLISTVGDAPVVGVVVGLGVAVRVGSALTAT